MKATNPTLIQVKKSVALFDSFTPARTRAVVAIQMKHAAGFMPHPGSNNLSAFSLTFSSTLSHSTTLSPQDLYLYHI